MLLQNREKEQCDEDVWIENNDLKNHYDMYNKSIPRVVQSHD